MTDSESNASETTVGVGAPSGESVSIHEPGSSVGRYLVIEEVGRGGMGVVLRAYDPKLQREVALKSVRTDAMTAAAQARMVQEARAMAKLSHPNVVSVYDVELEAEPGNGVVLAMEYVPGTTLRRWLESEKRPWREVVDAFIEAGRGLAAAHTAGLLHRDFKPANVLVGGNELPEGQRVVKVTDFGLALPQETLGSVDPDASHDVVESQSGSRGGGGSGERLTEVGTLVGTPAYMAPEQHEGAELGVPADQYAYCVSLWQGLTGELPFNQKGAELHRAKLEVPKWPAGLSVPKPIVDAVRKGLSPKPSDRFASMEELLEAIDYDSGRARRNLLTGLGAVAAVGVVASAWAYGRGRADVCNEGETEIAAVWNDTVKGQAEAAVDGTGLVYAHDVWEQIGPRLDAYAQGWAEMHRESCQATTLRGEQSTAVMDLRMTCLAYAKSEFEAAVNLLTHQPDAAVVDHAHVVADELQSVDRCADVEALQSEAVEAADPAAVATAMGELARARVLAYAGHPAQALEISDGMAETVESLDYGPLRVRWEIVGGVAAERRGDYAVSEDKLGLALEHGLQYGQWEEAKHAARLLAITVGERRSREDEALVYLETAWGLQGRNEADTEGVARLHLTHGAVARGQGELDKSQSEYEEAHKIWSAAEPPVPTKVAQVRQGLAETLSAKGETNAAERELRAAISGLSETLGSGHPAAVSAQLALGEFFVDRGMLPEGRRELEGAVSQVSSAHGDDHALVVLGRIDLAQLDVREGKPEVARTTLEAVVPRVESDPVLAPIARNALADALRAEGKYDEAEPLHRQALEGWEKNLGDEHPRVAEALFGLGEVERRRGKNNEAQELLERARRIVEKSGTAPRVGPRVGFLLAQVMWDLGEDPGKSRGLAEEARKAASADAGASKSFVAEVDAWLQAHPADAPAGTPAAATPPPSKPGSAPAQKPSEAG